MKVVLSNFHPMGFFMPLVKLKEKGQVTIPADIRAQIAAQKGDMFEVEVLDGNIVLKPQEIVSRSLPRNRSEGKGVDITKYIGSAKGLYSSPEEVDAFIRSERERW